MHDAKPDGYVKPVGHAVVDDDARIWTAARRSSEIVRSARRPVFSALVLLSARAATWVLWMRTA